MLPSWSRQLSSSSRGPHPAGKRIEIVNFLVNDAVRKITGVESVGVSLRTHTDYADLVDDISHTTVNYSRIVDQLRSLSGAEASFPHSLATNIADHVLSLSPSIAEAKVSLTLIPDFVSPRVANGTVNGSSASIPRPSRQIVVHKSQAASVDLAIAKQASTSLSAPFSYTVEGYQFNTIVGVLKTERQKEQPIILDITLSSSEAPSGAPENVKIGNHETSNGFQPLAPSLDNHQLYTHISESIQQLAKKSSFYTLEAYSSRLASHAFEVADEHELGSSLDSVTIRLRKPDAFADAEYAAVSTTRTRTDFGRPDYAKIDEVKARGKHRAFIALGSNMGDRIQMIEKACQEMKKRGIKMVRTSGLWETEAMYVTDQDPFVNGACEIETSLSPLDLLDELQAIENAMGRKKIIDKGPRNIDLDILLYDAEVVQHKRLHIPHALMLEREFVLRPLCELIPNESIPTPASGSRSFLHHLTTLPQTQTTTHVSTLTPLSPSLPPLTPLTPSRKTHIMAILNLTPDSFSDGGQHASSTATLTETITSFVNAGATILDIGGCSTRPHSPQPSADEELARILPAIHLIRSLPCAHQFAISIDTYRASVAAAALDAGAHIINDVSAGLLDPALLPTVAAYPHASLVLSHMRGDPSSMTTLTQYPGGLLATIASELRARVAAAQDAGIARWRLLLDPGVGFAKTAAQNLELLRRLPELRAAPGLEGLPWLVGVSRKGFVGSVTGVREPRERGWGTAGAVAACVAGGAEVVRVHDVPEMVKVVRMADAVWRA